MPVMQKLRPVFAAKLLERGKLIDDVLESSKIQEKLKTLPDITKTYQSSLVEALKPLLTPDQGKAFGEWLAKQQEEDAPSTGNLFPNPTKVVKGWVKLEGAWYAVTAKADIDPVRFGDLRHAVQQLEAERGELAKKVAALRTPEDGLREVRDQGDALDEKVAGKLQPLLSAAQEKSFTDWQRDPNSIVRGPGTIVAMGVRAGSPDRSFRVINDGPDGGEVAGVVVVRGAGPGEFRAGPWWRTGDVPRHVSRGERWLSGWSACRGVREVSLRLLRSGRWEA